MNVTRIHPELAPVVQPRSWRRIADGLPSLQSYRWNAEQQAAREKDRAALLAGADASERCAQEYQRGLECTPFEMVRRHRERLRGLMATHIEMANELRSKAAALGGLRSTESKEVAHV